MIGRMYCNRVVVLWLVGLKVLDKMEGCVECDVGGRRTAETVERKDDVGVDGVVGVWSWSWRRRRQACDAEEGRRRGPMARVLIWK